MTTEEKFDIIIKKLTVLEEWQSSIKEDFLDFKHETKQNFKNTNDNISQLKEDFLDFKHETEQNFENTNELINQAFEKISENISYQDKVTEIEKIIHSRQRSFS